MEIRTPKTRLELGSPRKAIKWDLRRGSEGRRFQLTSPTLREA